MKPDIDALELDGSKVPRCRHPAGQNAALTGECLLRGSCDAAIGHLVNGGSGPRSAFGLEVQGKRHLARQFHGR